MAAVGPALLCAWLLPGSLLAMEAIHDEDLDRVNAAGLCRPQGTVCETAAADPSVAQGTGMSIEEAQALRIKDVPLFREYMQKVWGGTDEFLGTLDPAARSLRWEWREARIIMAST